MSDPAIQLPPSSLTREQLVLIASRLFAAYLLFWVVSDLIDLPRELTDVVHLIRQATEMGMSVLSAAKTSAVLPRYMLLLMAAILKIVLWLMAAGWFYRCGPRIQAFFATDDQKDQ